MNNYEGINNDAHYQEPTEAEKVLGSMPPFGEFVKDKNNLETELFQIYDTFTHLGGEDEQNARNAINRALQKNNKTVFENLCDEINDGYIKPGKEDSDDYGAFDVACSIISANCVKIIEGSKDEEIGYAEALVFENKMKQKIAGPDAYVDLVHDEQVLEEITSRYKELREKGTIDQTFEDYLKSLSTSYGLMANSAQHDNGEHITPKQRAEWRTIVRAIENLQFMKMDQSDMKKNPDFQGALPAELRIDDTVIPKVENKRQDYETTSEHNVPLESEIRQDTEEPKETVRPIIDMDRNLEKETRIKEAEVAANLIQILKQTSVGSQSAMQASSELEQMNQEIRAIISGDSRGDIGRAVSESIKRLQYLKNEKFMMSPRRFGAALNACDKTMEIYDKLRLNS